MFGQWMGDNRIDLELGNKEIIKNIDKDFFFKFGETVLNLLQTQQAEIKKKDKESHFIQSELDIANAKIIELKRMIDLMTNYICSKSFDDITNRLKDDNIAYWGVEESIKQYFERKVENE